MSDVCLHCSALYVGNVYIELPERPVARDSDKQSETLGLLR